MRHLLAAKGAVEIDEALKPSTTNASYGYVTSYSTVKEFSKGHFTTYSASFEQHVYLFLSEAWTFHL